jgi:phosphopantetheine--protein transferase-like protein
MEPTQSFEGNRGSPPSPRSIEPIDEVDAFIDLLKAMRPPIKRILCASFVNFSKLIISTRHKEAELTAASNNNEFNETMMTENIGVDVEVLGENKYGKDRTSKFLKRIMTPKEYALTMESSLAASLEELSDYALFHFSMKEAVFKAMFPFVRTHISWKEVELLPNHDRSGCEVVLQGHRFVGNHGYRIRGQWWREGSYVISGVSARKAVGHEELKLETSVSCAAP